MTNRFQYNEVKGALAKLLATENLLVEHRDCETASFNVDTRVLTLPLWDCSDRVYNMLVGHEVGHALFTPTEDWTDVAKSLPKSYVNVTEDARIEKLMKRKFPGLQKDFYQGYQQLDQKDFFGIRDEDPNTLKLIDRINLYFKIGAYALIPFDDSEIPLRDLTGAAETFEEALKAALAIYEYENEQQKEQESLGTAESGDTEDFSLNDLVGGKEGQEGEEESDDADQPATPQQRPNQEPADLDTPSYEQENEETQQRQGGESSESLTAQNLESALKDMMQQKDSGYQPVYMEIDNIDINQVVVSPHRIHEETEKFYQSEQFTNPSHYYHTCNDFSYVDGEFNKFKRDSNREVNYLTKEFEMKKSAAAYARASVSRTGILDTGKLHTYKWNNDIFKKVTTIPDGKNHGLLFLLDWSGSMSECILDTYKQLLALCFFCRKTQIPFEVYAFVNDGHWSEGYVENYEGRENTLHIDQHFHLLNFLSSKLNNQDFDTYAKDIWRVCMSIDSRYGQSFKLFRRQMQDGLLEKWPDIPDRIPQHMSLGGTPLNEAIACFQTIIPKFQQEYNLEKCHVSILSDGEAQWSNMWRKSIQKDYATGEEKEMVHRSSIGYYTQLRDRKKGRVYGNGDKNDFDRDITKQLLMYMKGKFPHCNFLGFRIANPREVTNYLGRELERSEYVKKYKEWTKNKTVGASILGYQEIYFFSHKILNTDVEFEVDEDATKGQIKNAFKKSLKAKANNKKILSSFITQIA